MKKKSITINRRGFLKTSSLAALGGAVMLSAPGYTAQEQKYSFVKSRKKLIGLAEFGRKKPASGKNGLVISSHPLVSYEAARVLKEGGNAADAILAASITQTVVEPHMSTITGVLSMLYYDANSGKASYVNGSCNAPLDFDPSTFNLAEMVNIAKGPKGVIVPGFWGGFEACLEKYGTISRKELMQTAIRYAREGFEIHPFLYGEMFTQTNTIGLTKQGREIYMPKGRLLSPGELLVQKRAADTLERLAEDGSNYFYKGDFAKNFIKVMKDAGGLVRQEDFEKYRVRYDEPTTGLYREYGLIGSPLPDFGGTLMIEILQMAEHIDYKAKGHPIESYDATLKMLQILGEVLTNAAIERHTGAITPIEKSLSKKYAAERFKKLSGKPRNIMDYYNKLMAGKDKSITVTPPGSNHLTVADKEGNVATVLHSVMSWPWMNGLFVDGISVCAAILHYASGLPKPGKKINAGICPLIITKGNKPILACGSPSVSLMQNIFQNIVNILDFNMRPEKSVNMPRYGGDSIDIPGAALIEVDYNEQITKGLEKLGMKFQRVSPWNWSMGAFEGIYVDPSTGIAHGCGDPRRNSMAIAL
jgi:gamma-glutamyltranspeptidase/glutathione hydrolase